MALFGGQKTEQDIQGEDNRIYRIKIKILRASIFSPTRVNIPKAFSLGGPARRAEGKEPGVGQGCFLANPRKQIAVSLYPGRGTGSYAVFLPAPLPGCKVPSCLFRGCATKHPSRTPGYFPSALRAGESKETKTAVHFPYFFRRMLVMVTGSTGLSLAPLATALMASTNSMPLTTSPKTVCLPRRCGVSATLMKN